MAMYSPQDDLAHHQWALFHHLRKQDMADHLQDSMDRQDTKDHQDSDHLPTTDTVDLLAMEDKDLLTEAHMEDMRVARTDHPLDHHRDMSNLSGQSIHRAIP